MPCYDSRDAEERSTAAARFAKTEAMLCAVITAIDNGILKAEDLFSLISYQDAGITRAEISEWWKTHKQKDIARIKRERESALRKAERNAALNKLSDREKALLNLK